MIYINLLPVREILRRNKAKRQIFLSTAAVGCFLTILTFFGVYQANTIANLQKTHDNLQAEKQQYTKILNEIKKIEEEKKVLLTRIEVIKQLKQSSSLTVHVMDEVASLTPPQRMWLTKLNQTGADLKLSGMALDNQTVAKYMDDLENSQYIHNVSLVSASMEKFAERDLKLFSISCSVGMPNSEKK
jgi:type IV pilus assembly protein PilN